MNLPFVLDVAIGLIFTYLILSLLASELQELLTTVLQWRAKHLKDSIEVLLSGGSGTREEERVRELVSRLYNDSLLQNVNQEAKGWIANGFRHLSSVFFSGNRKGAFGGDLSTGPSYIPSETFASTIIEQLGITSLIDQLTEVRFEGFVDRIVGHYCVDASGDAEIPSDEAFQDDWQRGSIRVLAAKAGISGLENDPSFKLLVEEYEAILRSQQTKQADLTTSIERLAEALEIYMATCCDPESPDPAQKEYGRRLRSLKLSVFGKDNDRAILSGGLKPSLSEIAELVNQSSNTYKEVLGKYERLANVARPLDAQVNSTVQAQLQDYKENLEPKDAETIKTYDDLPAEQQHIFLETALKDLTAAERQQYEKYQSYKKVRRGLNQLPDSVKESLSILARRAQTRVHQVDNELDQFRDEIALWFDRSMSRASGVYKRNAKGVAILVGLMLAAGTNADTFHIFNRLSSDDSLRRLVTERAAQLDLSPTNSPRLSAQLEDLKNQTDDVLREIAFPISWSAVNLGRQLGCQPRDPLQTPPPQALSQSEDNQFRQEWADLYKACVVGGQATINTPVPLQVAEIFVHRPLGLLRMLSGWGVSGIAIAMGAPFWFDLLGKVVNVRNSGSKPKAKSDLD
ncbi:hypothetical protein [Myxacorys almedinensis]|uniref:Uncharacterized protein n=1 Tax=Myxacorys almedinensis A TaxID=2690445 RepID=A0A8J8CMU5_9CYAN|nr:hypothetical protein [Myxacorys almedinensis]NDJ18950.1 hypothetical protein [Myxacorys almedinensis A]